MWGIIKTEVSEGWFVPSIIEWVEFVQELEINKTNYQDKGLSDSYWSSSQSSVDSAHGPYFKYAYMGVGVSSSLYVRLTTTF